MLGRVIKLNRSASQSPPCGRGQSNSRRSQENSPLTPELKEFIDRAVVPVLVKQYLAITEGENDLAGRASNAAHSLSSTAARKLRAVRP
jgi:hypothetical protein